MRLILLEILSNPIVDRTFAPLRRLLRQLVFAQTSDDDLNIVIVVLHVVALCCLCVLGYSISSRRLRRQETDDSERLPQPLPDSAVPGGSGGGVAEKLAMFQKIPSPAPPLPKSAVQPTVAKAQRSDPHLRSSDGARTVVRSDTAPYKPTDKPAPEVQSDIQRLASVVARLVEVLRKKLPSSQSTVLFEVASNPGIGIITAQLELLVNKIDSDLIPCPPRRPAPSTPSTLPRPPPPTLFIPETHKELPSGAYALNKPLKIPLAQERALPLCLPNDWVWDSSTHTCRRLPGVSRTALVLVPESLAILRSISIPVAAICIAGPYRSGKSYILNRLLRRAKAFALGDTSEPCTMGVWMWGQPMLYTCSGGDREVAVLLLDTEGLGAVNASARGDVVIGVLSLLLSSVWIYNSKGVATASDLITLHFLSQLTQRVTARKDRGEVKPEELQIHFPDFWWLFRDSHLQPVFEKKPCSITEYLLKVVLGETDSFDADSEEHKKQQLRRVLLRLFPSVQAHSLVAPGDARVLKNIEDPTTQLDERFERECSSFIRLLLLRLRPKKGFGEGSLVTGEQLAVMAERYVSALNDPNAVPSIQSAWESAQETTFRTAISKAYAEYEAQLPLPNQLPISAQRLAEAHDRGSAVALQRFLEAIQSVNSDPDTVTRGRVEDLQSQIARKYAEEVQRNETASEAKCNAALERLYQQHIAPMIQHLSPDMHLDAIVGAVQKLHDEYHSDREALGPKLAAVWGKFCSTRLEEDRKLYEVQLTTLKDFQSQVLAAHKDKMRLEAEKQAANEVAEKARLDLTNQQLFAEQQSKALQEQANEKQRRLKEEYEVALRLWKEKQQNAAAETQEKLAEFERARKAEQQALEKRLTDLKEVQQQALVITIQGLQKELTKRSKPVIAQAQSGGCTLL